MHRKLGEREGEPCNKSYFHFRVDCSLRFPLLCVRELWWWSLSCIESRWIMGEIWSGWGRKVGVSGEVKIQKE